MRSPRWSAISVVGTLIALTIVASPTAAAGDVGPFTFKGSGWGHGVGLSQYGARAMAAGGSTAEDIVRHYYKGVSFATRSKESIRILVDGGSAVTVTSNQPFSAKVGSATVASSTGAQPFLRARPSSSGYKVDRAASHTGPWTTLATPSNGPVVFVRGDAKLQLYFNGGGKRAYHQNIEAYKTSSTKIHAVNDLDVEYYLRGVVPWEMPASWPAEALQAQAMVARSYAINNKIRRRANGAWYDLCATTSCQVYGGFDAEDSRTNAAVSATARKVVTHPDAGTTAQGVILGVFSSSSGGATENNTDGFGSSSLYPYLVSRDDPWSVSSAASNPYTTWEKSIAASTVASKVGLDSVSSVRISQRNVSGSAKAIEFIGLKAGTRTTVPKTGLWARSTFGLRSIYISSVYTPPFSDDDGHAMEPDIVAIHDAGITNGCTDTRFCPGRDVTRGQMAAFIARALELPPATGDFFSDDDGDLFEDDINRIAEAGITTGCADGSFCPSRSVSRAQMAAFIARGLDLPVTTTNYFDDDDGSQFEANINSLAKAGITNGCADRQYCPSRTVTRAQMAAFLARAFDLN